jgi:hypothetical protein
MLGLPAAAWERFGIWLAAGLGIYFLQKAFGGKRAA